MISRLVLRKPRYCVVIRTFVEPIRLLYDCGHNHTTIKGAIKCMLEVNIDSGNACAFCGEAHNEVVYFGPTVNRQVELREPKGFQTFSGIAVNRFTQTYQEAFRQVTPQGRKR